jgi:hypothetical protein
MTGGDGAMGGTGGGGRGMRIVYSPEDLITQLEKTRIPDIRRSMIKALTNVKPSHLLDTELCSF